jgi:imidazolonepropionase-like amidohydrolase
MSRKTIFNVEIFDGEKSLPGRSSVHVSGDRIVAVGNTTGDFAADELIDGNGMTLMPGMTTCHFHAEFAYLKVETYFDHAVGTERPPGMLMLVAANSMKTALMSGYTGVIGAACSAQIDPQLKMAMNEGIIIGPRILPCSRGLDSPGHGLNDPAPWWKKMMAEGSFRFCDGPDEFRRAVRDEVRMGAEIIKIFPTTGHGAEEPHNIKGFTDDELRVTIEAAHQRNVKVRAHCCYRDDIFKCIEYGVDVIDHGDEIDDEIIELMIRKGTYFVPSMYNVKMLRAQTQFNLHEAYDMNERRTDDAYYTTLENVKKASRAGVKVVSGDDYGLEAIPHALGEYSKEHPYYVDEVGVPATEVLTWATKNGAELLGQNSGMIAVGKLADLILVEGRPTEDIGCLVDVNNIRLIMLGGDVVKNTVDEMSIGRVGLAAIS